MMSAEEAKSDLAETRTEWAEDRTLLANERTFGGWMRTGMSAVAIGLGFQAIFREVEPTWWAKAGATVFILIGVYIFLASLAAAKKLLVRLESHSAEPLSRTRLTVIAMMFATGSSILCILLWLI